MVVILIYIEGYLIHGKTSQFRPKKYKDSPFPGLKLENFHSATSLFARHKLFVRFYKLKILPKKSVFWAIASIVKMMANRGWD